MKKLSIICIVILSLSFSDCLAGGQVPEKSVDYLLDRAAIEDLTQEWAFSRDQGQWERLAQTFHPGGIINISWYKGPFDGFIKTSTEISKRDSLVKHHFGVPLIKINGDRAISEVDFTIHIRVEKGPLELDVISYARYFDKITKKDGVWRIQERTAIYEKDRIDSVESSFLFWLVTLFTDFDKYPAPYRHLAFSYDKSGLELADGIFVNGTDETKALYTSGYQWLDERQ